MDFIRSVKAVEDWDISFNLQICRTAKILQNSLWFLSTCQESGAFWVWQ